MRSHRMSRRPPSPDVERQAPDRNSARITTNYVRQVRAAIVAAMACATSLGALAQSNDSNMQAGVGQSSPAHAQSHEAIKPDGHSHDQAITPTPALGAKQHPSPIKGPVTALPSVELKAVAAAGTAESRKVLYYRNPMGLPDVSASPKKDSMGMDYVPVYEGEQPNDPASVTLSPGRIQRSGVRTEVAEARVIVKPVRGWGAVKYDDTKIHSVSIGAEAGVDELLVTRVGEKVMQGQPLFRLWANSPQMLQIEIARRASGAPAEHDGLLQSQLTGVAPRAPTPTSPRTTQTNLWPSPITGIVIEKRVYAGQRIGMADELMRIADTSTMWVVADIAERDLAHIAAGQKAQVVIKAFPGRPIEGTVLFIFPGVRPESRTARIAIEVPNPNDRLKADMSADVVVRVGADRDPVITVRDTAIIDDGVRRHVLVDVGEGRFDARTVTTGAEGNGYVEVISGVAEGERIVVSANFLIDSEANLAAALAAFSAAVPKK